MAKTSKINDYRAGAVRCEQRAKKTRNQADRDWQGGTIARMGTVDAAADLALESCAQTFHPLICFSLNPFIGVERAVEPVNVLNTL